MWSDIDYMEGRKVFSLDPERFPVKKMREIVDYLHAHQQQYIMMVDPAVAEKDYDGYNRGVHWDAFAKSPVKGEHYYRGVVWPVSKPPIAIVSEADLFRVSLFTPTGSIPTRPRTGLSGSTTSSVPRLVSISTESGRCPRTSAAGQSLTLMKDRHERARQLLSISLFGPLWRGKAPGQPADAAPSAQAAPSSAWLLDR